MGSTAQGYGARRAQSVLGPNVLVATSAVFAGLTGVGIPLALNEAGFGKTYIAIFFVVTAAFAVAYNLLLVPRIARRGYGKSSLLVTAAAVPVGILTIRFSGGNAGALLIGGALMVFSSTLVPQAIGRVSATSEDQNAITVVTRMRQMLVGGYIVGLGVYATVGSAGADPLVVAAVVALVSCAAALLPGWSGRAAPTADVPARNVGRRTGVAVLVSALLLVGLMKSIDVLRGIYLPLFAANQGASPAAVSVLFLVAACCELVLLPVLSKAKVRFGTWATLAGVALAAGVSFAAVVSVPIYPSMVGSQVVYAVFGAGFQSVGMVLLAEVTGRGTGHGAAVFMAVMQVGTVLGAVLPLAVPGYSLGIFILALAASVLCAALAIAAGTVGRSENLKRVQQH